MTIPKKYRQLLLGLAFAPLGGLLGYGLGAFLKRDGGKLPDLGPWLWVWLVLDIFLAIAWHELGHVAGGLLSGFEFQLFAAGPLRIDRGPRGLECKWNANLSLWGGLAATTARPEDLGDKEELRRKMLRMVAMGPLFSLAGGLALLPASRLWATQPVAAAFFGIFAFLSLTICFATLLPLNTGGYQSDGARVLSLLRRDEAAHRWVAAATLGSLAQTKRPREWPQSLIESVTEPARDDYDGIMGMWMRYCWHADRKEHEQSELWLNRALAVAECWPEPARPILYLSAADFHARVHKAVDKAREYWREIKRPGFLPSYSLAVTEAAILALEGQAQKAREHLASAKANLHLISGSSREAVLEAISEIEASLN